MRTSLLNPAQRGTRASPFEEYVIEDHADYVLHTSKTQAEAIIWARAQGFTPLVARVRDINDKRKRDHWRAA